uniref:ATP-dependent DNA helicase n=1 Tax=Macrostomum lignano TaxID=282301 RepID=A0A1I8G2V9_9PLAT
TLLHECNLYVRSLKAAAQRIMEDPELVDARIVIHPDRRPSGEHIRRYNLPTANEVGILIVKDTEDTEAPEDGDEPATSRDVVIQLRGGGYKRISKTHRSYDALEYVRGPTSFEALHTVDGVLCPSAKAACTALGLLQRDDHWRRCLAEAVQSRMPRALRHLLAVILIWGNPEDGSDLWCTFAEDLCEDLRFHHRDLSAEEITDLALRELQSMLTSMGGHSLPEYGLPAASVPPQVGPMQFDPVEQAEIREARLSMLTEEQIAVYESVTADLVAGSGGLHFLDAPAGTGKTFLLEVLLAFVRSRGELALAVAASGIAATLLPGGQTAHSTFKIPVRLLRSNKDVCAVGAQSKQAEVFRRVRLIVWDEISRPIRLESGHARFEQDRSQVQLEPAPTASWRQNASTKARAPRDSTLTAFFKLCRTDEFARGLVYTEVPSYFVWHHSEREWRRAKKGSRVEGHPGVVHNTNIARMYTVRGPTSFEALHTVDGVLCPSAKAACTALGLLQRDDHWRRCLAEAVQSRMPRALRHLLAVILIWGNPEDGSDLWCTFAEDLCEDLRFHHRDLSAEEITDLALRELQSMLTSMGGHSLPEYGLPAASVPPQVGPMQFDPVEQAEIREARLSMLTEEQIAVYESVTADLVAGSGGLHFLDAPAGTGKTFLLEVLLAFVRSRGELALAVAASGIAATLLPGGQTAHSTFKIPVRLLRSNKDVCAVGAQSKQAEVFRRVRLIVWDEISMTNRKDLESVDRCLRDVRKQDKPFGGVTLVCSGDFRQLLPVVVNGTRANSVMACVCRSSLWKLFKRHRLTRNIRLLCSSEPAMYQKFTELLMQ